MADDEAIEQTLHIAREVDVYQIPPRPPTGHSSGTWLVGSKIFTGRLRVVSKGMDCEVRLEAPDSDQLFACCPIKYGQRTICVETVIDSSRYFVLRVEDPASKRHAFLGVGFQQRGDAFDFNEALIRHEKFAERERAASQMAGGAAAGAGAAALNGTGSSQSPAGARRTTPTQSAQAAAATQELASLYSSHGDLSLKAGQTIHVSVKPVAGKAAAGTGAAGAGSSWLTSPPAGGPGVVTAAVPAGSGGLFKLAPPPADAGVRLAPPPAPAPAASTAPTSAFWQTAPAQQAPQQQAARAAQRQGVDLLDFGWDVPAAAPAAPALTAPPAQAQAAAVPVANQPQDWAVFD